MHQVNKYTLHLHNVTCQIYFNKKGKSLRGSFLATWYGQKDGQRGGCTCEEPAVGHLSVDSETVRGWRCEVRSLLWKMGLKTVWLEEMPGE